MDHIWAPWRMEYILSPKSQGCIFCDKPAENRDDSNYIILRGEHNFVMLNSWPYNPGHLLVVPYKHAAGPEELSDEELLEHWHMVSRCTKGLRELVQPNGFNIGINIGRVAGAGVLGHVHTHIVPRWEGDMNFMPVISSTRVLPEALVATYQKIKGNI